MGDYSSGPVGLLVDVQNSGPTPSGPVVLRLRANDAAAKPVIATKDVSVLPNATFTIPLNHPVGLLDPCAPNTFLLNTIGDKAVVPPVVANLVPACTFGTQVEDGFRDKSPDHEAALKANRVFIADVKLSTPFACGGSTTAAVKLVNGMSSATTGVVVELHDTSGVMVGKSAPVDLAKGATTTVALWAKPSGTPGRLALWVKSSASAPADLGYWSLTISRKCALSATLK